MTVLKCLCGKLYETFNMTVEDQSVCPACRAQMRKELKEAWK